MTKIDHDIGANASDDARKPWRKPDVIAAEVEHSTEKVNSLVETGMNYVGPS